MKLYDVKLSGEPPDGPAKLITDIKDWLVRQPDKEELLPSLGTGKKLTSDMAARGLLSAAARSASLNLQDKMVWILLPSFNDNVTHKSYKDGITASVESALRPAGVSYLLEPEMVLEYFRLHRKEITYPRGRIPLFLIVDCGALTCNTTLVMGTLGGQMITGHTGKRRAWLQSVSGDSVMTAGRWVDQKIFERYLGSLSSSPEEGRDLAERVKLLLSKSGNPVQIEHTGSGKSTTVTSANLDPILDSLVETCLPAIRDVLARGYEQLRGRPKQAKALVDLGVTDAASLSKALTAVVFSGGTTLLPRFCEKVAERLEISAPLKRVGEDYAQAAAIGAMCHLLEAQKPRATTVATTDVESAAFLPSLPADIHLEPIKGGVRYSTVRVLSRGEWLDLDGGATRSDAPIPADWPDDMLNLSLIWAGTRGRHRHVRLPGQKRVETTRFPRDRRGLGLLRTEVKDTDLTVQCQGSEPSVSLYANLARSSVDPTPAATRSSPREEPASNDVVLDFGMSKLAFVVADGMEDTAGEADLTVARRPLNPFFRIVQPGAQAPPAVAPPSPLPAPPPLPKLEERMPQSVHPRALAFEPPPAAPPMSPDPQSQQPSEAPPGPKTRRKPSKPPRSKALPPRADDADELVFLRACLDAARGSKLDLADEDLIGLHLAAKTRPFVMLSGPPGIGKTSLALFYAGMLGCNRDAANLSIVHVQPDWINDSALVDGQNALLRSLIDRKPGPGTTMATIVLDEVNLTRPDYYLMRLLAPLEGTGHESDNSVLGHHGPGRRRDLLVLGTLNVDEASRPPSDKVLDRAFLIEPRAPHTMSQDWHTEPSGAGEHPGVTEELWARWSMIDETITLPQDLADVWTIDGIPRSRRALRDMHRFVAHGSKPGMDSLISRQHLLDLAVFGRLLPRLRGDRRTAVTVIDKLHDLADRHGWSRTGGRLKAMRDALDDGFATFWCE